MKRLTLLIAIILLLSACSNNSGGTSTDQYVHYKNCTEVREAGADPIHEGDPGFQKKFDRDGDGVGCEKY